MPASTFGVVGVVAAYQRPHMLRDLLASLADAGMISNVVVVDNALDSKTEAVCKESPIPVLYHQPERNLSCGGGIARGLTLAMRECDATHLCLFDDDAQATPGAVEAMVRGMMAASADVAVPLIVNERGDVSWFPGLQRSHAWEVIRRPNLTPDAYRAACGLDPVPFSWSPWPVMTVSARAVIDCGLPRDDFWLCGEDVEYALRLTWKHKGVLVPSAVCRHLPPPLSGGDNVGSGHYHRFCFLLQNMSYAFVRLPHARRALRHLPGNYLRFLRTFGVSGATLRDAWLACWRGALRGKPAGAPGGDGFKQRFLTSVAATEPRSSQRDSAQRN